MSALRARGALSLELTGGATASSRWLQLLAGIDAHHSIAAAARAIGLSYKAAWDAIDSLNNMADSPVVSRVTGGKGGGGARLTVRGAQLLATWLAVAEEHRRIMRLLNTQLGRRSPDVQIIGRFTMLTSARNHFAGKVVRVRKGAVNDEIEIELGGGSRLVATVTRASTQSLALKRGREVVALVKASWIIIARGSGAGLKLSARNRLAGTLTRLTRGAVNSEVVITLAGGNSVAAVVTNDAVRELGLKTGQKACAIFKASSVILGVND